MEVGRPDRYKGYIVVWKVAFLFILSYSFSFIAWDFVDEYFYAEHSTTAYALLMLFGGLSLTLGSLLGYIVA